MTNWRTIRIRSGQSIVFMAVLLLVLIGFAGLSIDTGKAFQQQRTIQSGANGAAVAGMNQVVLNQLDSQVQASVLAAIQENGGREVTQVGGTGATQHNWGANLDTVYFRAMYLDENGSYINDVGSLGANTPPNSLSSPAVAYVQVITFEPVSTTFMKVVGTERLNVSAEGIAGLANCQIGVMPLTFHESEINSVDQLPVRFWDSPAATIRTQFPETVFNVGIDPDVGNFMFVQWLANSSTGNALEQGWTGTGTLMNGFEEATPPQSSPNYNQAIAQINGIPEAGDFLASQTGGVSSLSGNFDWHRDEMSKLILPLHDERTGTGNNRVYRITKFIKVRLLSYKLTPAPQRNFEFTLLQEKAQCSSLTSSIPPTNSTKMFYVHVDEVLKWKSTTLNDADVTLVMDFSKSMKDCWTVKDGQPGCTGAALRRYDSAKAFAIDFANQVLDPSTGSNNQLAIVVFGLRNNPGQRDTATKLQGFTNDPAVIASAINNTTVIRPQRMSGNTATADGLNQAYNLYLTDPNRNPNAQPVVIIVTDGLTNVLFEPASEKGRANTRSHPSYPCGVDIVITDPVNDPNPELEDPFTQATCPSPVQTPSEPPIESAIGVANQAKLRDPRMRTFGVVLGSPNGLTIQQRYLDRMTAYSFMANDAGTLDTIGDLMADLINNNCAPQYDAPAFAVGAQIRIESAAGTDMGTYTVDGNGQIAVELEEGEYRLFGTHLGVVSPNDPSATPQNYTRLRTLGSTEATSVITFNMPNTDYTHERIELVIDDEANVSCN